MQGTIVNYRDLAGRDVFREVPQDGKPLGPARAKAIAAVGERRIKERRSVLRAEGLRRRVEMEHLREENARLRDENLRLRLAATRA